MTNTAPSAHDQYRTLVTEMLGELNQALDEHVVRKIAGQVEGLRFGDNGQLQAIEGDPQEVIQDLVDACVGLSNAVVIKTLQPLLKQCPWIRIPGTQSQ